MTSTGPRLVQAMGCRSSHFQWCLLPTFGIPPGVETSPQFPLEILWPGLDSFYQEYLAEKTFLAKLYFYHCTVVSYLHAPRRESANGAKIDY